MLHCQRCVRNVGHFVADSANSDINDQSNSSDSESEFDLSDPEAGLATSEDELFISQTDEASSIQQFSSGDAILLWRNQDSLPSDKYNNEEVSESNIATEDDTAIRWRATFLVNEDRLSGKV